MPAVPPVLADPTLLNGSFENPVLGPNAISSNNGGTFWTPNGANVNLVSNNFNNLGVTPFGNQYLGFSGNGASDTQTVSGFLSGQSYVLHLFYADIANNAGPQVTVMISGAASATGVFDAPVSGPNGPNPYPFQEGLVPFTTTAAGGVTFALIDTGLASIAVDNVSIQAVPEPSSRVFLLLLSGALVIRAIPRIRRRLPGPRS